MDEMSERQEWIITITTGGGITEGGASKELKFATEADARRTFNVISMRNGTGTSRWTGWPLDEAILERRVITIVDRWQSSVPA